ncbi:predicted protein [Plenodomus lingam JN3]|uniref:Uncharacterized protein n=2 Tax=Leptosphaeria maculans TaxID=5022 RepID=E4ZGN0_LEPMJ|nr:predicted protein [Plenodomus lingam JN3]CBX90450.1 predicted protein [Plenodomus lingam JN3]
MTSIPALSPPAATDNNDNNDNNDSNDNNDDNNKDYSTSTTRCPYPGQNC